MYDLHWYLLRFEVHYLNGAVDHDTRVWQYIPTWRAGSQAWRGLRGIAQKRRVS